jgi:hypothetical protein
MYTFKQEPSFNEVFDVGFSARVDELDLMPDAGIKENDQ